MSCSVPNEECGEQPNAALCGCMPRFMFMAKFDVSILSATLSSLGLLVWVFAQRKTGGGGGVTWCSLVEISSAVKCFLILSRVSGFNRILVIDTALFFW